MRLAVRILLYVCGLIILVMVLGYVYLFHFGGLEEFANDRITRLLANREDIQIRIGEIDGSLWHGVALKEIDIYYHDSTTSYRLCNIPRLETAYSLSNLWNKYFVFDYLRIDSAEILLRKDSTGKLLIPKLPASTGKKTAAVFFSVGALEINNMNVSILKQDDTLLFQHIYLYSALQAGDQTFAIDLERLEFTSNEERFQLEAGGGKITYANGNAVFQNVVLVADGSRLRLNGNVSLDDVPSGMIDISADNINLADITAYIGPSLTGIIDLHCNASFVGGSITGSADIAGNLLIADFDNLHVNFSYTNKKLQFDTLYGAVFNGCSIDGSGAIDFSTPLETYRLQADIKNFNLNNLIKGTFESNLSGRINLQGESFRQKTLKLMVNTDLYESSFDEYPLQEVSGDIIITVDSITFADNFTLSYYENMFDVVGTIIYSDTMALQVTVDLQNLDRYRGKLFIDQPGGRGYAVATLTGVTSDPDLQGTFTSDSCWIYGLYADSLSAQFDIKRFLTGRKGCVKAAFFRGSAWDIPYDTGYISMRIDSTIISIDTTRMFSDYAQLQTHGTFDYGAYPQQLALDTLSLMLLNKPFYNRRTIDIGVDSAGFIFTQSAIGNSDALLSVQGRIDFDESLDVLLSIQDVPIAPWLNLFDTSYTLDGRLSCAALLHGSIPEPEFTLYGNVDSLSYRDLVLGDLSAGLQYKDRLLTIDSVTIISVAGEYNASGSLHVDLSFTSEPTERFPDLPMDIHITAHDKQFDLVSLVMPSVETLAGIFWADIRLSGTPHSPHLDGEAYIKNADLKYFDLENHIYSDSAGVMMRDNKIIIDHIELYTTENKKPNGRRRYAYVEGEIIVKSLENFYYDLDVELPKEFPFAYELDNISGKVEGELHVQGDTPPLVTGDLTLVSTKYMVNFAEEDEGSPMMMALSGENTWDLNINVDIISNYWIKNDDIDAEFAGQINLIREKGQYRFIGEMEILRGRGFLFDKVFRLEPGSKVIFEGNDTLNPRLDIIGYTRIAAIREATLEGADNTPEQIELGIHVTGTLEAPIINPVEGSEFSREDILPLIFANYYSSDSLSSTGQIEQRLFGLGYSQVSQIGARQLGQIGVETFEIDPLYGETLDPLNARVTLGSSSLIPRAYLYIRSTLSGQTRQEVGFEYRLNRAFQVEGRRDENELYHLNLKFHWEF